MATNNDSDEILVALRRIMRATELRSQELLRQSGLTAPQLLVLQAIGREGSAATNRIAKLVHVSHTTATRVIDRLLAAGLVSRVRSGEDRRVVLVALTDEGRARLNSAPELLQARFLRRFDRLAEWERHMLTAALLRIAQMMDAEDLDAAPILDTGDVLEKASPEAAA